MRNCVALLTPLRCDHGCQRDDDAAVDACVSSDVDAKLSNGRSPEDSGGGGAKLGSGGASKADARIQAGGAAVRLPHRQ
jgi:hypothetical protein